MSIREPILPECRLALTLTFLSHTVDLQLLAWSWKMGKETARKIILETCEIIWNTLFPIYVGEPTSTDFAMITNDFENMWNMPNCVGSIDGKHVAIVRPRNTQALFYNYKKFYSIVLMAACDARYTFTFVDLGSYGGNHDGGIFSNSRFGQKIIQNTLPIPPPKRLPGTNVIMPHFFTADAAFPLAEHIMKPYPGQNLSKEKEYFNKRISRARGVIENSFGILVARWRVLQSTLHFEPENAEKIVLACIALHNFIMLDEIGREIYCPNNYVDSSGNEPNGGWRLEVTQDLHSLQSSQSVHRLGGQRVTQLRDKFCTFLSKYM